MIAKCVPLTEGDLVLLVAQSTTNPQLPNATNIKTDATAKPVGCCCV
ncbi:MAG: hypothetical protein M1167_00865 [Chloroflexi bacterium]|nr:hypothetical protein [Chloroflexota bacterium]